MRKILSGFLLLFVGWMSVSAVQAQVLDTTWTMTPVLKLTDTNNDTMAAEGETLDILFVDREKPLRAHLSVRIDQTGSEPNLSLGGKAVSDLHNGGDIFGLEALNGGIHFTAATSTNDASVGTLLDSIQGARDQLKYPDGSSNPNERLPTDSAKSEFTNAYLITWGPDPVNSGSGAWCVPTSNSCVVELGYIEFIPDLPAGASVAIQAGGQYSPLQLMEISTIIELQNLVNVVAGAAGTITIRQGPPLLKLTGSDVALLEGDTALYTVMIDPSPDMLPADAMINLTAEGASSTDFMFDPAVPYTMLAGTSQAVFTFTALDNPEPDNPVETLTISLEVLNGGMLATTSMTYTVRIFDTIALPPADEDGNDAPIDGTIDRDGDVTFAVRLEGSVRVVNNSGNVVKLTQAVVDTTTDPVTVPDVVITIDSQDPSDAVGDDFIGTKVYVPAAIVDDGIPDSDVGLMLTATLEADISGIVGVIDPMKTPTGFAAAGGGIQAFDITLALDGAALSEDVTVCLPYDNSADGAETVFRYNGSTWEQLGRSNLSTDDVVCGTTRDFSAFAVFYGTAVPNVTGDDAGTIDQNDALILYYAYSLRNTLGVGR